MIRVEKAGNGKKTKEFNLYDDKKNILWQVSLNLPPGGFHNVSVSGGSDLGRDQGSKNVPFGKMREWIRELEKGEISERTFQEIISNLSPFCHGA